MRFEFKKWLTKKNDFHSRLNKGEPVPLLVMFGTIIRETEKSYYIEVEGKPEPSTKCLHCGRKLTHPISLTYGLGPKCGKHYYISDIPKDAIEEFMEEVRKMLSQVKWRGFIPKSAVNVTPENLHIIEFIFKGVKYRVETSDQTKIKKIHENSDKIVLEEIFQI